MRLEDLLEPLDDPERAQTFARDFLRRFVSPAFGALSKTEVDILVFGLLVEAGAIEPRSQVYEIARDLNVTPAKARNLLFQWQIRNLGEGDAITDDLVTALRTVRFGKDGDLLSFGVESPLLREELRSRLKKLGIFADASFASEMIRLPTAHFVEFLDDLMSAKDKRAVRKALVADKRLKDRSFKALVITVLKAVATKLVGKAADDIADQVTGLVKALLDGDGESVASIAADVPIDPDSG